ncbi:MAG: hypothetical protein ACRDTE_22350, partial [Pseudonocardiaceae bacterium]
MLRIPPELLWFRLPEDTTPLAVAEPAGNGIAVCRPNELIAPAGSQADGRQAVRGPNGERTDDAERDPVLVAPWNHRGTVEVAILLSGGGRVKRRVFLSLAGPALTAPAHQWLVHEPEPLVSGLTGHRVSGELVNRFELRRMDDVAGGSSVLAMTRQAFAWVAGLLDKASYDERTGQALHVVLAELAQFCGWSAYDLGEHGLAQRYYIAGLRAAHTADDRPLGAHILATMTLQAAREGQPAEG